MSITAKAPAALTRLLALLRRAYLQRQGAMLSPKSLILFVGNPRSGTTLVRSMLNAHPAVAIAQEYNLLERFKGGERSWTHVLGALYRAAYPSCRPATPKPASL